MSIASTLFPFSVTPQRRTSLRRRFNGAFHFGALNISFSATLSSLVITIFCFLEMGRLFISLLIKNQPALSSHSISNTSPHVGARTDSKDPILVTTVQSEGASLYPRETYSSNPAQEGNTFSREERLRLPRQTIFSVPIQRKSCWYKRKCSGVSRNLAVRVLCSQMKLEGDVDDEACELVSGVDLVIGEAEDSIHAYLLKAVKNNNGTGILLLSDIFGFEDSSTRDFAYRVACNGYNVLVPDLFRGAPWRKGQPHTEFDRWLATQSPSRVAKDIDTSSKWLIDEFTAAGISKKLGIIGFCFGGGKLIETLARDQNAHFGTGVCFYGTRIDTSLANNIKAPILFICGDNDHLCPVDTLGEMEKNVAGSKVLIYEERGHGFAHRPESQEEDEDAEDAFAIMRNWLHDCLVLTKNHVL